MSTSKLQRQVSDQLSVYFGGYIIRENIRPEWLRYSNGNRLELDFYLEDLDIAIEVQGSQHYIYTPHFHDSYKDFKRQQKRDIEKKTLCKAYGVTLIEIGGETEIIEMIRFVRQYIAKTYGNDRAAPPQDIDSKWDEKFHSISKTLRKANDKKDYHIFKRGNRHYQKALSLVEFYGMEIIDSIHRQTAQELFFEMRRFESRFNGWYGE
ncbi:hypothetical protein LCGC14_1456220 [marine sediment metagenome]|uniref:Uncharacterized protein n=1 Tax=marine sediment metagenome TaxID=412755 RepID=A0A0F9JH56_9ZZZZ